MTSSCIDTNYETHKAKNEERRGARGGEETARDPELTPHLSETLNRCCRDDELVLTDEVFAEGLPRNAAKQTISIHSYTYISPAAACLLVSGAPQGEKIDPIRVYSRMQEPYPAHVHALRKHSRESVTFLELEPTNKQYTAAAKIN